MIEESKKFPISSVLLLLFCLLRLHIRSIPVTISVYAFDLAILLLVLFRTTNKAVSKHLALSISALGCIITLKMFFGLGDADTFLAYIKIIYYCIVLYSFTSIFKEELSEKQLRKILLFCFWYNFIIVIIQLLAIPGIGNIVYELYGSNKLRNIWGGYPRVYGTFFNANWFGVYLVFMISYFTTSYCDDDKLDKYLFNILIAAVMLFVSGSRTAVIGSVISIVVVLALSRKFSSILKVFSVVFVIFLLVVNIANRIPLLAKTMKRFSSYFTILFSSDEFSTADVAGSRWEQWGKSMTLLKESPIFGNVLGDTIPHNTYIAVLIRFGLLGSIILALLLFSLIIQIRGLRVNKKYWRWAVSFSISIGVIMMSGDYLFSTQVMLLFLIIVSSGKALIIQKESNNQIRENV